ncbi:hypothetical protein ES703_92829 [subsurface metagenome]
MGKGYDKKVKVTRILLADYLALKRISQLAGISMPEALHRLIEHQAQLPLLDMRAKPASVIATKAMPAFRSAPVITIATNGSKVPAFRIKPGRVRYD